MQDKGAPGFVLYLDQLEALQELDDNQFRLLIMAEARYTQDGTETTFDDPVVRMAWRMILPKLRTDCEKYSRKIKQTSEAGKASVRQRSLTNVDERQQPLTNVDNTKEIKINQDEPKKESGKHKRFTPPTLDEVVAYMEAYSADKGLNVNIQRESERFLNHFEAQGWAYGKAGRKISSWQAAARNWIGNEFASAPPARAAPARVDMAIDTDLMY